MAIEYLQKVKKTKEDIHFIENVKKNENIPIPRYILC